MFISCDYTDFTYSKFTMKRRKKLKRAVFIAIIALIMIVTLKASGILNIKHLNNKSNFPNIEKESTLLVSNLINPKIGDFVVYHHKDSLSSNNQWINRLVGKSNDTIHIKNGIVYRNHTNFDQDLNLVYDFKIPYSKYSKLKKKKIVDEFVNTFNNDDIKHIQLTKKYAQEKSLMRFRTVSPDSISNPFTKESYRKNWNKDHFGPIIIPENKYFVLADNRDNGIDSRYIGLIDKSDILGVVFLKF